MPDVLDPLEYKIYSYFDGDAFDKYDAPMNTNYVSGLDARLYPIVEFNKGRIEYVRYYASASLDAQGNEVGDDLVVCEHYVYVVDAAGFARARSMEITWFRNDGSEGDTKIREKIYNNEASRTEGRRRRRNVIDKLSIQVVGLLAATETLGDISAAVDLATPWMADRDSLTSKFIELSSYELQSDVINDLDTAWMNNLIGPDVTIRHFIISELS